MRFLVDAHLPCSLCELPNRHGHDAVHTIDLQDGNKTPDRTINQISVDDERVVVSKDSDFFYSHLLLGRPWKLLLVKTGNISALDLHALFARNMPMIEEALRGHTLVEIDRSTVAPRV